MPGSKAVWAAPAACRIIAKGFDAGIVDKVLDGKAVKYPTLDRTFDRKGPGRSPDPAVTGMALLPFGSIVGNVGAGSLIPWEQGC